MMSNTKYLKPCKTHHHMKRMDQCLYPEDECKPIRLISVNNKTLKRKIGVKKNKVSIGENSSKSLIQSAPMLAKLYKHNINWKEVMIKQKDLSDCDFNPNPKMIKKLNYYY